MGRGVDRSRPEMFRPRPRTGAKARPGGRPRARGRRTPGRARQPRTGELRTAATRRLRGFRRATLLAVALTGVALILLGLADGPQPAAGTEAAPTAAAQAQPQDPASQAQPQEPPSPIEEAADEAAGALQELAVELYGLVPRLAIALLFFLLAWLLVRILRSVLRRTFRGWERASAATAVVGVGIWVVAIAAAFAVLAGDARALVGSVGLFGLALSWALQTPIESFTGWLLNSFRTYYRVGDRIAVGEVYGDVYRIDVLTTTVWETAGPESPLPGGQSGALVTFPNLEILRSNVVNYTRDFPYIWQETAVPVSDETDLAYAMELAGEIAARVVGDVMAEPARAYRRLLDRAGIGSGISADPQVFLSGGDSWTSLVIRYLVPARERRRWSTSLQLAISREFARPEHADRIRLGYPRREVELRAFGSGAEDERPSG